MPVISNTSPILNLAIIGQLDLLHRQFGVVWIPPAVLRELELTSGRPGVSEIRAAMQTGWLRLADAPEERVVALLRRELDEGESEAIALSLQLQPEYVLLDERDARRVAKSQQLPVVGVVGVLIRGKLQGDLPSLRLALEDLRARAGFYLSAAIVASAVATVGEQA